MCAGLGSFDPHAGTQGEVFALKRPDGTSLHIESFGAKDAPRIILTHGWGLDRRIWHYTISHLAKRYRVVIWDLPGLGHSMQPKNRDFSLEKLATDLRAVLDATGDQPAILVGHSIGGMITLTFCKVFPDMLSSRVAGVSIVHSTYTNPLRTTRFATLFTALEKPVIKPLLKITILLSPMLRVLNILSYMNGSAHRSTARESFAGNETKGQLDFASRYTVQASPAVIARGMLGMLEYDVTKALATVDVPTQVVVGDEDRTTLPEAGQYIHLQVPDSKLSDLTPAKHLGLFEQHDRFNQLLADFVAGCFSALR